jgi:hypothetical protein
MGGNKKLADFLETYNLSSEMPQTKYKTKAAAFYRQKVTSEC